MSLNWNVEDCVGRKDWSDRDHEVLDTLIGGTLLVGLHRITEANLPEWLLRMRMERANYEHAFAIKYQNDREYYVGSIYYCQFRRIRLEHLRKFIGLRTNGSNWTRAKWLKKFMERMVRSESAYFNCENNALKKKLTKVGEA